MKKEHRDKISGFFPVPLDEKGVNTILDILEVKDVPTKTILQYEGEIATKVFLVFRGCLRSYFVKENGSDITSQFFIEEQMVTSIESVMSGTPTRSYIETIEDSEIGIIQITNLLALTQELDIAKDHFIGVLLSKLINYMNLHASFILDNPEKRYRKLQQDNPELVSRLPLQYIASYLGITPVSLSRIRARISSDT